MATKKRANASVKMNESMRLTVRLQAVLFDGVLRVPVDSIHGRLAARTYAYSVIASGDEELGNLILDTVGEGD